MRSRWIYTFILLYEFETEDPHSGRKHDAIYLSPHDTMTVILLDNIFSFTFSSSVIIERDRVMASVSFILPHLRKFTGSERIHALCNG